MAAIMTAILSMAAILDHNFSTKFHLERISIGLGADVLLQ
jgi:hypothetical protein